MTALRLVLAAVALVATAALVGCGDSLPVEDRALILAVGIDPGGGGANLEWTFVLPNVTATASSVGGMSPSGQVFALEVRAPDLSTALSRLQARVTRKVYMGDLEALAIGLDTPSERARALLSDLVQLGDVPDSYVVVATPDPTRRLLTLVTRQDVIPRYFLTTYLDCAACGGFDWRMLGWRWWADSQAPGKTPHTVILRPTEQSLVLAGSAVYRPGPAPAAVMPSAAADGLGYLDGKATAASVSGVVHGRRLSIRHVTDAARTTTRLSHGRVEVTVRLRVIGTLTGQGGLGDEAASVVVARRLLAHAVLKDALAAVRWANDERCDPFGYTNAALLARPRLAYATPRGTSPWYPIDARVTVEAEVVSAGTAA